MSLVKIRHGKSEESEPWRTPIQSHVQRNIPDILQRWLLFRYPFHPRVTAVARKRSFSQKCKWQVTAKHACTLRMWLCMKWYGAWLYGVHRMRRDGSSFMWQQPCQRCKYTTLVNIKRQNKRKQTTRYKKLVTHAESHAGAVSLFESGER